jgi:hypothetical protein
MSERKWVVGGKLAGHLLPLVLEGEEEGIAHLLLLVLKDTGKWPAFVYVDRRTGFVSSSSVRGATAGESRAAAAARAGRSRAIVSSCIRST